MTLKFENPFDRKQPPAVPQINLNGTAKQDLMEEYMAARAAVAKAREAVQNITVHGRDYHMQPEGTWAKAREEHYSRIERLLNIENELTEIALKIQEQGR